MTRRDSTIPADYFDDLYRSDPDPWRFRTSDYERDKYRATAEALTHAHYATGLEIGCSIGVLTRLLAPRCAGLLAVDASEVALATARADNADLIHVGFERRMVPDEFPDGRFDLIVLSEVLYYLQADDLRRLARQCLAALQPAGEIVLCHWLGDTDYPLTGQEATDLFVAEALKRPLRHVALAQNAYRLDRLNAS